MEAQKPEILVFPFDLLSHYLRCLEFTKAFSGQFSVLFRSSEKYNSFIAAEDFKTFACTEFNSAEVLKHMRKFSFKWLDFNQLDRIFREQLICIEKYKPEFVIGDMSPTLKMAAEAAGVPFISIINGYMSKYYALQRPVGSSHPAAYLQKILPPHIFDPVLKEQETKAFRRIHEPFNKLRRKYRLTTQQSFLDELEGDHTFICDNPEIFPQHKLPENYEIIGPLIYSVAGFKNVELPENGKMKILVTFGSSGEWKKVSALAGRQFSEYDIITLGDKNNLLKAGHITNIDFADLNTLLPQVKLLICHGGNGTLNLAYKHKIPFIAFPSIMEQEWNAVRFSEMMAGRMITKKISAEKLLSVVNELIKATYMPSAKNAFV